MPQDMAGKLTGSRHGKGLQMSLQVTVCLCVYPLCHTKSQCGSKNAGFECAAAAALLRSEGERCVPLKWPSQSSSSFPAVDSVW
eukprot:357633-Chlamydomonas_euryale.AAC.12